MNGPDQLPSYATDWENAKLVRQRIRDEIAALTIPPGYFARIGHLLRLTPEQWEHAVRLTQEHDAQQGQRAA